MYNIGNIITDNIFTLERFNVLSKLSDADETLPTLIIGYNKLLEIFPDYKIVYNNNKITDLIYWTYSKNEKRNLYQRDLYNFRKLTYNNIFKRFTYFHVDFILLQQKSILKIFNKISNAKQGIICKYDKGFFVLIDRLIFGFNYSNITFSGNDILKMNEMVFEKGNLIPCDISKYDTEINFLDNIYQIPILTAKDNNFF
jgi:hypothetical protein